MAEQDSAWKNAIRQQLSQCRQWEAGRILRRLGKARLAEREKQQVEQWLEKGLESCREREAIRPLIRYPEQLPVSERSADIRELIERHQVVIVAGETGSGKTTQLPKICLEAGRGRRGLIGHTQPRRIAARTVSQRLAEEMQTPVGEQVGYQVRFTDQTSPRSLIKVMTDGILLAELDRDRFLDRYDTLIIDEAHERSLNIDFLLGALKQILPKRPDLKLIITSATIELDRFSRHFQQAPVVEVTGRTYPVEVRYRPLTDDSQDDSGWPGAIESAVAEIEAHEKDTGKPPGDVLVFLPGERDIRLVSRALRHAELRHTEVLPLYARLSAREQNRVFQNHSGRRIVLATNVAETSLTVPGIRYVIDTGLARLSRYSVRSKIQRLPIEPISQASANQRKGRCGRVAPGICFRLYDESDFNNRPEYTDPEIRRTNLASVILQMAQMRLGDIRRFPFIDAPDGRLINDGYKLLEELGAVNGGRKLTPAGRAMARLPVDPRLARMLLEASDRGALREVLIICAGLSIQDPRDRPADRQQAADQAHQVYSDPESDFVALIRLWERFESQRQDLSQNQLRKWCQKQFLNYLRLREWREVHHQLALMAREQGLQLNREPAESAPLHQSLLSGLLGQVAVKEEKREYLGTRNRKLRIFPGSPLVKTAPKWIMAAEVMETSQVFAKTVARIEPDWIEPLASHIIKRQYAEPHWERKRAQVIALETQTLYGLTIVSGRRVGYASIDPETSREIFIRRALVEGDYSTKAPFVRANQALTATVEALEEKVRRRDLLVDEETLFQFYHERLPAEIVSGRHFETWWKSLDSDPLKALELTEEDVLARPRDPGQEEQYPDQLHWSGLSYELRYHFAPGAEDDGVSIRVPLMALKQLPMHRLEWLVPGLLREKCIQLVKGLPKSLRRNFVPVPDFVDAALANMTPCNEPLTERLGAELTRMTGVKIPPEQWNSGALLPHLRMNIQLLDERGGLLAQSRDLSALRARFESQADSALARTSAREGEGDSGEGPAETPEWNFQSLPEKRQTRQGGMAVTVYPVLEDQGRAVRQSQVLDPARAEAINRRGVARLLLNRLGNALDDMDRRYPEFKKAALLFAPYGKRQPLLDDLLMATAMGHFLPEDQPLPRDRDAFEALFQEHRDRFHEALGENVQLLHQTLERHHRVMKGLKGKIPLSLAQSLADLKFQMSHLVYPGFLQDTPSRWRPRLPVYMQAALIRLEKMPREAGPEREFLHRFEPFWQRYVERREALALQGVHSEALVEYRWMLEEYRVSYFAQQLGTAVTVSPQRLEKQWQKVQS
ncbi:MAG: ATP-dependent RNA helicase HrpA [Oleiphilaceae bacterium]|nr:ATP-dependent RNA helicase HrpA [Oleiphilaceae bacterium]